MAEFLFEAVKTADLTRYARELAAAVPGDLAQFLPNRQIDGVKSRQTLVSRTTTKARFRAFDAETPIGKRPAAATVTEVALAPIGQKLPVTESQIIAKALAGGDLTEVISALYDDTSNNVAAITNLAEALRAEFLFSGAISINDNGVIQEADFGLAGSHNLELADLDAPWDGAGDALEDELDWVEQVREDSDEEPVATIGSAKVRRALLKNASYLAGVDVARLSQRVFNEIRAENGLPPFYVVDTKIGGVRITPEDKIAIVTRTVGETQWGITAEELELLGARAVESATRHQPRIVASAWKGQDPVTLWSKANATALPVAGDINGLFVAQVLAGSTES